MPRTVSLWKYDALINGHRISSAMAVLVYRANHVRHWHVTADNKELEEEIARELFPSVQGRYSVPLPFALKPEDQADIQETTDTWQANPQSQPSHLP